MATLVALPAFYEYLAAGIVDWDSDTLKCALVDSGAAGSISTASVWADVSSYEIANGNGYTTGGATIGTSTVSAADRVTRSSTTVTLDCDDVQWTATGGEIPAWRYAVLYSEKVTGGVTNPIIGYVYESLSADVDATPEDTPLIIRWNPSGVYTITGA